MARKTAYAQVRGYRLAVPDGWALLSYAELTTLQNGVGPDCWPDLYRQVLDALTGFRAAADVHDPDYALGRTRQDRLAADRRFFWNCLRIVLADAGGLSGVLWRSNWWKLLLRVVEARALYRALRLFGKRAFVASTKLDVATRGQKAVSIHDDLYADEV